MDRRAELLYLARRARIQWINDAADPSESSNSIGTSASASTSTGDASKTTTATKGAAAGAGKVTAAGGMTASSKADEARVREMDAIRSSIGSIRCLDEVLRFLTEVSGDGDEAVSLETLLLPDDSAGDIEGGAVAEGSELPEEPYAQFIHKLKLVSSAEIVKFLHNFVINLESEVREALFMEAFDDAKLASVAESMWTFLRRAQGMVRENAAWAEESTEQWERSKISLEAFVQIKLHRTLFIEDTRADSQLYDRIQSLKFITPEHLDIKATASHAAGQSFDRRILSDAVGILTSQLNAARHPLGKVECLKDCSTAIFKALQRMHGDATVSGADDFLPLLILVLIDANPPRLKSNLKYIQSFVNPAKLVSEAGYIITQFVSAVHFLDTVDASALTISPLEFETAMARCRALAHNIAEEASRSAASHQQQDIISSSSGGPSRSAATAITTTSSASTTATTTASSFSPQVVQVSPGLLPPRKDRSAKARAAVEYVSARAIYSARCDASSEGSGVGGHFGSSSNTNTSSSSSSGLQLQSDSVAESLSDREYRAFRSSFARALDRWDARLHPPIARSWAGTDAQTDTTAAVSRSGSNISNSSNSDGVVSSVHSPLLHYVNAEPEMLSLGDIPRLLSEYKLLVKACSVLASESHL